jgi:hypothetical protein
LVRAAGLQPAGRGFESLCAHLFQGGVVFTQLCEVHNGCVKVRSRVTVDVDENNEDEL